MKGRRPQDGAIRRGRTPATEIQAQAVEPCELTPPADIRNNMRLSKYWRQVVGDGRAYTEQDIPTITAYVTTLDMQDQLKAMLYTKDGNLKTCQGFGDEDEDGFMAVKESPYFNQYQKAVTLSLKLAQELGATPLSRARLGVTRATEQSMQADVAHKIRELMRQEGA